MNVKVKWVFIIFLIGFVIGVVSAGLYFGTKSAGEIANLNRRYDELNREYTERQQLITENQQRIKDEIEQYIGGTAEIAGRTSENAIGAITNLREASDLIKQSIAREKAIEMELDRIRAYLRVFGVSGGE